VIGYAVDKGASKITLSTNPKLAAALNLYRKLGFVNVVMKNEHRYKRELIHMELNLSED
jgi:ribosomal protein S18 acetylase RimI-like enzyme